jgi:hypothetical protein
MMEQGTKDGTTNREMTNGETAHEEQGRNPAGGTRATFVEVFRSIKFSTRRSSGGDEGESRRHETGFAENHSRHAGVAASDDYTGLVLSSN